MTGWCPIDGEVCRHDGYCSDCPIQSVCEQTEQKGNMYCLRKIAEERRTTMADGIDLYNKIDELAEKIDNVLSDYGLQIGTICGQYKNPVELTITVEEKDDV